MTTAPALYAATPTVSVAGEASGLLSASLEELVVTETVEGLAGCEASFQNVGGRGGDPDFQFFDRELLDFGQLDLQQLGIEGELAGQKQGDAQRRRQAREGKEQVGGQCRHPKRPELEHDLRQHGQERPGKPGPDNPGPALPLA